MLTANRFDEIKTFTADLHGTKIAELSVGKIAEMATMLAELAVEVDRMRTPAQAQGRGHLKPVILDGQGNAIAPPPISQQLAVERRAQYDSDRFDAIMAIPDIDPWRVFSLRWGLSPPPGGWDDHDTILRVIHSVRIGVKNVPLFQKTISASWLYAHGIALPPGVTLSQGVLSGVDLPD